MNEIDEKTMIEENKLQDEKIIVMKAMKIYGGGFVLGLSEAIKSADPVNVRKIKKTFNKEWNQYLEMGKKMGVKK